MRGRRKKLEVFKIYLTMWSKERVLLYFWGEMEYNESTRSDYADRKFSRSSNIYLGVSDDIADSVAAARGVAGGGVRELRGALHHPARVGEVAIYNYDCNLGDIRVVDTRVIINSGIVW